MWLAVVLGAVAGASAALIVAGRKIERARREAEHAKAIAQQLVAERLAAVTAARECFVELSRYVRHDFEMLLRDPNAPRSDAAAHHKRATVAEACAVTVLSDGRVLSAVRAAIAGHLAALERLSDLRGIKSVADRVAALDQINLMLQRALDQGSNAYRRAGDDVEKETSTIALGRKSAAPTQERPIEEETVEGEESLSWSA